MLCSIYGLFHSHSAVLDAIPPKLRSWLQGTRSKSDLFQADISVVLVKLRLLLCDEVVPINIRLVSCSGIQPFPWHSRCLT